jgi:hypothetical protein
MHKSMWKRNNEAKLRHNKTPYEMELPYPWTENF